MNRVCVFVDGSNFYFGLKRNNRTMRVDYHQLSLALCGDQRRLIRTYYYNGAYDAAQSPDKARAQRPFFDSLERTPQLELRLGRLVVNREGVAQEKGVGIKLASDIVYYAAQDVFDTAIVVTESQEYAPVLQLVKELGRTVELALFHDAQPRELVKVGDRVILLDEVLNRNSARIFVEGAPANGEAAPAPTTPVKPAAASAPEPGNAAPKAPAARRVDDEDEDSQPQPLNSGSGIIQRLFGNAQQAPNGNVKPRGENKRGKYRD
jgi:uncharacterized LabA/DUF88 family protein